MTTPTIASEAVCCEGIAVITTAGIRAGRVQAVLGAVGSTKRVLINAWR